jgi:ribosomal-protein-alanine N-acetyltransferase
MVEVETRRLRLRPIAAGDLPALKAMFADPDVMRFLPTGEPRSVEETQAELDYMVRHWRECGFGVWAVILKDTGEFAGYCGLQYLHEEPGGVSAEALRDGTDVEVVAGLGKPYWSRGIAPEATRAALRYGFETLRLPRIIAAIHPDNGASRHILTSIGMVEDPLLRYYGDTPHFVIRREEWNMSGKGPKTLGLDYAGKKEEVIRFLESEGNALLVLATSAEDRVLARTVLIASDGLDIYFYTWKHSRKCEQIRKNPRVALCKDNVTIEGVAEILGSLRDERNADCARLLKAKLPGMVAKWERYPSMVIVRVRSTAAAFGVNIDGETYMEYVDLENGTAHAEIWADR